MIAVCLVLDVGVVKFGQSRSSGQGGAPSCQYPKGTWTKRVRISVQCELDEPDVDVVAAGQPTRRPFRVSGCSRASPQGLRKGTGVVQQMLAKM